LCTSLNDIEKLYLIIVFTFFKFGFLYRDINNRLCFGNDSWAESPMHPEWRRSRFESQPAIKLNRSGHLISHLLFSRRWRLLSTISRPHHSPEVAN